MKPVDEYFLNQKEPYQSIMLYVRSIILNTLPEAEERYSYKIPFYNCHKKPMIYLNILKGTNYVDVAFVQGILLEKQFPVLKNDNKRKQVRSIQLKTLEDLDHANFFALLHEASNLLSKSKKAWFI
ncbi:hypothetical protein CJ739_2643 [Mariniflexile rhizosphaerae]|uniref:DUF1801 domain-containing protein n=1 Tax=unclassified Mariniflexile TaxID=2643887 RepID=UPI000CB0C1F2|nr:DUF1801 domain-containing protein [Mariniflexile sp. TRM1-10]AXP81715.1 hypothetical protein CJ739_2643 [Mariniflexile sp. TRM1-10]PLB20907.1 MAG: 2-dehydro-3-deoxyphosphooctonate aldolase [Flavobacteriaceae bacterium FS1-H7996/R]